jgi:hypothetical protein
MPLMLPERFFKMRTSSSNLSFARAEAPPSAFQPSTSPRKYAWVNGIDFDIKRSATSGKAPSQRRLVKTESGTHGSVDAHPPGIMCGGSAGFVLALAVELATLLGVSTLVVLPVVFAVPPEFGSDAGFSLDPQATVMSATPKANILMLRIQTAQRGGRKPYADF